MVASPAPAARRAAFHESELANVSASRLPPPLWQKSSSSSEVVGRVHPGQLFPIRHRRLDRDQLIAKE